MVVLLPTGSLPDQRLINRQLTEVDNQPRLAVHLPHNIVSIIQESSGLSIDRFGGAPAERIVDKGGSSHHPP